MKDEVTVTKAAKVFLDAARETPKQMFSPWAAFFAAARDIAVGSKSQYAQGQQNAKKSKPSPTVQAD
jgi:hypothetical protein